MGSDLNATTFCIFVCFPVTSTQIVSSRSTGSIQLRKSAVVQSIPSIITLVNCLCGFALILLLIQAQPLSPTILATSTLFIYIAWILDMVDGPVARLLKAQSQMGVQLDSFADLINFGFAPAVLIVLFDGQGEINVLPVIVGSLYLICALLRLAQFNADQSEEDLTQGHLFFRGFPSPTAALAVAGLVGLGHVVLISGLVSLPGAIPTWLFYGTAVFIALLMITTIPFADVPKLIARNRSARYLLLVLLGSLVLFGVPVTAVVLTACYLAYYLLRYARLKYKS